MCFSMTGLEEEKGGGERSKVEAGVEEGGEKEEKG